jgi:hypothetical protein
MSDMNPMKKAAESASIEKLTEYRSLYLLAAFVLFIDLVLVRW